MKRIFYVEDGQAKRRQETCEFCLACAQNCPQKTIELTFRLWCSAKLALYFWGKHAKIKSEREA